MVENKKSSILLVLKVLEQYSDEEHFITQTEIANKIKEIYHVELERKSIASSIKLLEELDYDIERGKRGGYSLFSRVIDRSAATYIVDALLSSRSIEGKLAQKICEQIFGCFSIYQKQDFSYIKKSTEINRTNNNDILYIVSLVDEAIKRKKRIGFQYLTYDKNGEEVLRMNGYQFVVSPYYLINNFGRYYLLCNYREKYGPLTIFRVDYMKNIVIKDDWEIKPLEKLKGVSPNFSITNYINDHIYMYSGEPIDAVIELDDEKGILAIKDWFGESATIWNCDGKIKVSIHSNENALYFWIMQYSDLCKVVEPEKLVNKVKNGLLHAYNRYK